MGDLNVELLIAWTLEVLAWCTIYICHRKIKKVPANLFVLAIQIGLTGGIVANPYQSHDMPFVAFWWMMLTPVFWKLAMVINGRFFGDRTRSLPWLSYVFALLISGSLGLLVYLGVIDMGWVIGCPSAKPV